MTTTNKECADCGALGPWTFTHAADGTTHCPTCAETIAPVCDDGEDDHSECTHNGCRHA